MAKAGRRRDHYVTSWGDTIVDFGRRPDGRWVDLEDRDHPWVCDDERDAIAEFYRRKAKRLGRKLPFTDTTPVDSHSRKLLKQLIPHRDPPDFFVTEEGIPEDEFWSLVGEMIRKNPKLAARKTGIEELAYLKDLSPPPPPLTLQRIGELYCGQRDRSGRFVSKDRKEQGKQFDDPSEGRKSWRCWQGFCEALKPVEAVEGITNADLLRYHAAVHALGLADKTIKNRYNKIGSVLKYAWELLKEYRPAIAELKTEFNIVCKAQGNEEPAPDPIDVEDFHAIFRAADKRWRAILLCMMNFAMHPKECGDIEKRHLDLRRGTLDNKRKKRGKCRRVAMVWRETAEAIRAYQELQERNPAYARSEYLFLTTNIDPTKADQKYSWGGLTQYFRETLKSKAEKVAGRPLDFSLDQIRDGAQNAADDGGADPFHTMMLMGHKLPGALGSYKNRVPTKTAKSVECIHRHYRIAAMIAAVASLRNRSRRPGS